MEHERFSSAGGFIGKGFGPRGPGFGPGGPGGPGFGPGHGPARLLKRAAMGTAAVLLDGPANAEQVVQRVSDNAGGTFTPPRDVAEIAIAKLAGRGWVTVDNGVASLTDEGREVLAKRGVTPETARLMQKRLGQFAEAKKIWTGMREIGGMARTIVWSGTEAQKATLAEVRRTLLAAVTDAKKTLHTSLGEG